MDDASLDLFAHISDALKGLAAAIEQVEARLVVVENKSYSIKEWEKIILDMGFQR